jgi:ribosomal protein S27E
MVFWGGRRRKFTPRPDGRAIKRKCPGCGKTSEFREGDVRDTYSVYSVSLFDDDYHAVQCSSCGDVMDLDKTLEPELNAREQRKLAQQRERELATARREREQNQATKQRQVDDELAALKRRLGKD